MDYIQIITAILFLISGTLAGYITNKYAVRWLFKPAFGRFKCGILDTPKKRGIFIHSISQCVEDRILTPAVLGEKVRTTEFRLKIKQMINSTLNFHGKKQSIKEANTFSETSTFSEIKGFNESITNIESLIHEILSLELKPLLESTFDKVQWEKLLSECQLQKISSFLLDALLWELNNAVETKSLDGFMKSLYSEIKDMVPAELLQDTNPDQLSDQIIQTLLKHISIEALSHPDLLRKFLQEFFETINIKGIVQHLQDLSNQKTIGDFLFTDVKSKEKFAKIIQTYLAGEKGKTVLTSLLQVVFRFLSSIHGTVFDLLTPNAQKVLEDKIMEIVPKLVPELTQLINRKSAEIDILIEESLNRAKAKAKAEGQSGENFFIDMVVTKLIDMREDLKITLLKKIKIPALMIDMISEFSTDEAKNRRLAKRLVSMLKDNDISYFMEQLESKGHTPEKVASSLKRVIQKYGKQPLITAIHHLSKLRLSFLSNIKVEHLLITYLPDYLTNRKEWVAEKVNHFSHRYISTALSNSLKMPCSQLFGQSPSNEFIFSLPGKLLSYANNNKANLFNKIYGLLSKTVEKINISSFMTDNLNKITEKIQSILIAYFHLWGHRAKEQKILKFSEFISSTSLAECLSEKVYSYVDSHLEDLLSGQVKGLVEKSLSNLDTDALCDLAEEFMGKKELKYLSTLGGIFGFVVALLLLIFYPMTSLSGFPVSSFANITSSVKDFAISLGAMAVIGVTTNAVAIWFLLHPKKQIPLLSKIPGLKKLSQGLVLQNQGAVASTIGSYLGTDLLKEEKLQSLLQQYRPQLSDLIETKTKLLVQNYVKANSQSIALTMTETIKEHEKSIATHVTHWIQGQRLSPLMDDFALGKIREIHIHQFHDEIEKGILDVLNPSNYAHNNVSTLIQKDSMDSFLNEVLFKALNLLDSNTLVSKTLNGISDTRKMNDIFKSTRLFDQQNPYTLPDSTQNSILLWLSSQVESFDISTLQAYISKILSQYQNDCTPQETLGQIFGGRVKQFLDQNIDRLLNEGGDFIKQLSSKALEDTVADFKKNNLVLGFIAGFLDNVTEEFKGYAIPTFIDNNRHELHTFMRNVLETHIYEIPIAEISKLTGDLRLQPMFHSLIHTMGGEGELRSAISGLTTILGKSILSLPLKTTFHLFGIKDATSLCFRFHGAIEMILKQLTEQLQTDGEKNCRAVTHLLSPCIQEYRISTLLESLPVEKIAKNCCNRLESSQVLTETLQHMLQHCYVQFIGNHQLSEVLDAETLRTSISSLATDLLKDSHWQRYFSTMILHILENQEIWDGDILNNSFRDWATRTLSGTFLDALIEHSSHTINYLEIHQISEKQINSLTSQELIGLVKSFAEPSFKRLTVLGSAGAFFGINSYLSILFGIFDSLKTKTT